MFRFRFIYLISPTRDDSYYCPSSLVGLMIQNDIISIYLKKEPTADEKKIFDRFVKVYTNTVVSSEEYSSLDKQFPQAHFNIGKITPISLKYFLEDLII